MASIQPHILVFTFPIQGHINPSLQFAKRLLRLGVKVTFSTSLSAYRKMSKAGSVPEGLSFAAFSDGFDDGIDGIKRGSDDAMRFMTELRSRGSNSIKETILSCANDGYPVTCLVYTIFLQWAAQVARELAVPSALLWIQPASVLDIYYYYFNGYKQLIADQCDEPSWSVKLPGLPSLKSSDLPSFCLPSDTDGIFELSFFKEQFEILDSEENPKLLVNTFDALEPEALKAVDKLNMIAVGPLIPYSFLNGKDPSDTSFGGDLFEKSKYYMEWMSSKPEGSIIYISFGSILVLSKKQKEEIAQALLEIKRPFLWVIRDQVAEKEEEVVSCMEELEELGMIVPWCSQVEVLSHSSLGCFVTHCGWNSTLESIVSGVPVVAFPHWTDQSTNAKLLEDVWRMGVRVTANKERIVERKEMRRCIEMVMGRDERGVEMRKNAKKWKDLGREAMKEGGSSHMNLKAFVEEFGGSLAQK